MKVCTKHDKPLLCTGLESTFHFYLMQTNISASRPSYRSEETQDRVLFVHTPLLLSIAFPHPTRQHHHLYDYMHNLSSTRKCTHTITMAIIHIIPLQFNDTVSAEDRIHAVRLSQRHEFSSLPPSYSGVSITKWAFVLFS